MAQVTVIEHLLLHQKKSPAATGVFTLLLTDLIVAAKLVSRSLNQAGLLDVLGETGDVNVQGERVQKLDDFANRMLIHRMQRSGALCAMASEENADIIPVPDTFRQGEYILVFDPLDGSSNIDVNGTVGTIFSILRRTSPKLHDVCMDDLLQAGTEQVAAGYFIYGSSTMMVYSAGQGVHGFTLDPTVGEFLLSHADIRIPERGKVYSVNEGNQSAWSEKDLAVVRYFSSPMNHRGAPYSLRYVGALVADFHRTLLQGGIFMYPLTQSRSGTARGKLRLLYEASPLAFVVEQAGGAAVDGERRILDIMPSSLHERVPLFIGSKADVEEVLRLRAS